jgi:hypothetical protein
VNDEGVRAVLLTQRGLLFVPPQLDKLPEGLLRAVAIELADLGYALSMQLRQRLLSLPPSALTDLRRLIWSVLARASGADQKHEPLFRRFPADVPDDTFSYCVQRVLVHYLQRRTRRVCSARKSARHMS